MADFARQRGVERDTISQYIRRHPELFDEHIKVEGKNLFLDDVAERLLDEKYPLPRPIEIVEDIETIKELSETRKMLATAESKIGMLYEQLNNAQRQIAENEVKSILLEDKEKQLQDKDRQLEESWARQQDLLKAVDRYETKLGELRSRNLWERIIKKGE